MNFVVIICSVSRPEVMHETVQNVLQQDRLPEKILLSVASFKDVKQATLELDDRVEVAISPIKGLTAQRNYGIKYLAGQSSEVTIFIDDDVELGSAFFTKMLFLFSKYPDLIGASAETVVGGHMVEREFAKQVIDELPQLPLESLSIRTTGKHWICHGCNMFFRTRIFEHELFDEELPLYSYAEDYDFSIRAARHGRVGRIAGVGFAHLTYSGGRVSEKRRGYSMVANNYYFIKKRVLHLPIIVAYARFWLVIVLKETVESAYRALIGRDSTQIDYYGRVIGRCLAVWDILRGRCSPKEILNSKRFSA
jgi:GT2 family glycosyltransferase